MTREKITLDDAERSRIRWLARKRAYVAVLEFARRPRGGRVRPSRTGLFVTREGAEDGAEKQMRLYRDRTVGVTVFEVDALGNVLAEERVW